MVTRWGMGSLGLMAFKTDDRFLLNLCGSNSPELAANYRSEVRHSRLPPIGSRAGFKRESRRDRNWTPDPSTACSGSW